MARYLLDTHIALWAALEPERLSSRILKIFSSKDEILFMSAASVWELAIKHEKGSLELKDPPKVFVDQCIANLRLNILPIQWSDCIKAAALPKHHLDPFDRMIIHHALDHSLALVSHDPYFKQYGLKVLK